MLTAALSSHSELLTACGKTSHDGRAVKPTTGPQNLFPRDYRPTSLQRPPRQQSLPVSEIGFVSKFPKPTGRRLFSRAAIAQFCTKSPIGFVFSVHGPWVLHAQICTNMHKSAQRPHSTIAASYQKLASFHKKGPTTLLGPGCIQLPLGSPSSRTRSRLPASLCVRYRANRKTSSIRPPETGPCFDELFEI